MIKHQKKSDFSGRLRLYQSILIIILPITVFCLCLSTGRMHLSLTEVFKALLGIFGYDSDVSAQNATIIRSLRLPRLILASLCGAGLSVSGCTFQNVFSNPLATPDTLGVASGASFGAAAALLLGFRSVGVQLTAFAFGIVAVSLTWLSAKGLRNKQSASILAGIMIGSLFSSLVSLVKFTADTESELPAITYWLMGSLENAGYRTLAFGAPPIIVGIVILYICRWRMNTLSLTDDEAVSSGVNIRMLRMICQICATLITASCVAMCGQVGWVGLLVPHICRMWLGSNNASLIPASIGIGAAFMMIVDTLARTVSPKEIPVSILIAVIGAPFFIYLLRRNRGWSL